MTKTATAMTRRGAAMARPVILDSTTLLLHSVPAQVPGATPAPTGGHTLAAKCTGDEIADEFERRAASV
jgi:hypothetical protein